MDEAESSWLRHATEDAKSDDKGRGGWGGRGSRADTAVDECRNEMVDRVARYRFDSPRVLAILFVFRWFAHGMGARQGQ